MIRIFIIQKVIYIYSEEPINKNKQDQNNKGLNLLIIAK